MAANAYGLPCQAQTAQDVLAAEMACLQPHQPSAIQSNIKLELLLVAGMDCQAKTMQAFNSKLIWHLQMTWRRIPLRLWVDCSCFWDFINDVSLSRPADFSWRYLHLKIVEVVAIEWL